MTLDTEQRIETTAPAQPAAKPPPEVRAPGGYALFQTMDELRARHSGAAGAKQRVLHAASALIGGSLLFAALYAVILFLE